MAKNRCDTCKYGGTDCDACSDGLDEHYTPKKKPEIRITDEASQEFWDYVDRLVKEPSDEDLRESYRKGLISDETIAKAKDKEEKLNTLASWKATRFIGESDEDFKKRLTGKDNKFQDLCTKIQKKYKKK